jgi:hypothetical protein
VIAHVRRATGDEREETARELLRQREVIQVLEALAGADVDALLLKGTALAYSVYDRPSSRPRVDTDLLVARPSVDRVRRTMSALGYHAPPYCDGELLFCQFPLERTDAFGLVHTFDIHWRISTQSMFADVLTFEGMSVRARPVPSLGPHARMPGFVDALLLACIHPAMHHQNEVNPTWLRDVELLAARLTPPEWETFVDEARDRKVAAVCDFQLAASHRELRSPVPPWVFERLREPGPVEPTAEYLEPNREWIDEQWANLRGLTRWRDRLRLLREVVLPSPAYMLERARSQPTHLTAMRLPYLYCRRLLGGGWRVLGGRK